MNLTFVLRAVSQEEKVAFMAVNGTKTLLLSAYMEHRKDRQVSEKEVKASLHCVILICFNSIQFFFIHNRSYLRVLFTQNRSLYFTETPFIPI